MEEERKFASAIERIAATEDQKHDAFEWLRDQALKSRHARVIFQEVVDYAALRSSTRDIGVKLTKAERSALREAAAHSLAGAYDGNRTTLERAMEKL